MGKNSIGTFKCCSDGKDLTCYYCISCKTIQHKSCIERKKSAVYIKDYRILCSKKCENHSQENVKDEEIELIQDLREIIAELQNELREKNKQLERQTRKSIAFEDDVEEAEEKSHSEILEQKEQIQVLQRNLTIENKKRINDIEQKNQEIKDIKENLQKTIDQQKSELEMIGKKLLNEKQKARDLEEEITKNNKDEENKNIETYKNKLDELNESLTRVNAKRKQETEMAKTNIRELKEETHEINKKCSELTVINNNLNMKIKELEEQLIHTNRARNQKMEEKFNKVGKNTNKQPRNRQILLMSGPNGYNYGKIAKEISKNTFDTNCQSAKTNFFENITINHSILSRNYTEKDYKIIFTSNENARLGKNIDELYVREIVEQSNNTNLILVGAPFVWNRPILNKFIENQNQAILNQIGHENRAYFIDCNKIIRPYQVQKSGELTNQGKWQLMNYIFHYYLQEKQIIEASNDITINKETNSGTISTTADIITEETELIENRDGPEQHFLYPRLSQLQMEI